MNKPITLPGSWEVCEPCLSRISLQYNTSHRGLLIVRSKRSCPFLICSAIVLQNSDYSAKHWNNFNILNTLEIYQRCSSVSWFLFFHTI